MTTAPCYRVVLAGPDIETPNLFSLENIALARDGVGNVFQVSIRPLTPILDNL